MKTSKIIASNQDYIDLYNGASVPIGHNFLSGEIPEHVYPIREEDLPPGMPTRLMAEVISGESGERFLIAKETVVPPAS